MAVNCKFHGKEKCMLLSLLKMDAPTAPFNNMQTLKFTAQLTNAFFHYINHMFGGSSQLLTTSVHCFVD